MYNLSLSSLLWSSPSFIWWGGGGRGGAGAKKGGTIIPVYNSHTHSKRSILFQFTIHIHIQNAQLLFQFTIHIHIQYAQTNCVGSHSVCLYTSMYSIRYWASSKIWILRYYAFCKCSRQAGNTSRASPWCDSFSIRLATDFEVIVSPNHKIADHQRTNHPSMLARHMHRCCWNSFIDVCSSRFIHPAFPTPFTFGQFRLRRVRQARLV